MDCCNWRDLKQKTVHKDVSCSRQRTYQRLSLSGTINPTETKPYPSSSPIISDCHFLVFPITYPHHHPLIQFIRIHAYCRRAFDLKTIFDHILKERNKKIKNKNVCINTFKHIDLFLVLLVQIGSSGTDKREFEKRQS